MSTVFFVIAPTSYNIDIFYSRCPKEFCPDAPVDGRFTMEINKLFYCMEKWELTEADRSLMIDSFSPESLNLYNKITNPTVFVLNGVLRSMLYTITESFCDDADILVDINLDQSSLLWGNELVVKIRQGILH